MSLRLVHSRFEDLEIVRNVRPTLLQMCGIAIDAFTSKIEVIGGKTDRCSHAVGLPIPHQSRLMYMAATAL